MNSDSKKPLIIIAAIVVIVVAIFIAKRSLSSAGSVNSGTVQVEVKKATDAATAAGPTSDSRAGDKPANAMLPGGKHF